MPLHAGGDIDAWAAGGGAGTPSLFTPCERGAGLEKDFDVRWPKQTAAGVRETRKRRRRRRRGYAKKKNVEEEEEKDEEGPETWGDGGATEFPGATGAMMAVLHNRLVAAGEIPESRRIPRQPY